MILAFVVEAGWMLWFGFHVGFHVLLWKTLLARFAVAWRHRGVEISEIVWCWFCVEMVASLRCWFCNVTAFTQSLIHACVVCLSRSWGEIPAGRPSGVGERGRVTSELQEIQEMFKPCSRERESAHTRASFLTVRFWTSPTGGWSNQSVGTGRSPACTAALARHFHVTKNNFYPCIKTLTRFTHL